MVINNSPASHIAMDTSNLDKPIIITTGVMLHNQVSQYYKQPVRIILAKDINALFQILEENIGALLLLDLSLFNDNVEHPEIKTIFKKGFEQRIIVITSEADQDELYKLFEQGVRGFCHPTISDELMIKAINAVDKGELWIGRNLIGYLMSKLILDRAIISGAVPQKKLIDSKLTLRESEIASCVAKGKCDKIIARDLEISPNTVKNHLRNIFNKLQIADRFQLALVYHGITLS